MGIDNFNALLTEYYKQVEGLKKDTNELYKQGEELKEDTSKLLSDSKLDDYMDLDAFKKSVKSTLENVDVIQDDFKKDVSNHIETNINNFKESINVRPLKNIKLENINEYISNYNITVVFLTNDILDEMDSCIYTHDISFIKRLINKQKNLNIRYLPDGINYIEIKMKPIKPFKIIDNGTNCIFTAFDICLELNDILSDNQEYKYIRSGSVEQLEVRRYIDQSKLLNQITSELVNNFNVDGDCLEYIKGLTDKLLLDHSNGFTECRFDVIGMIENDNNNNKLLKKLNNYL